MKMCRVCCHTSGSFLRSHASFGPTAWLVSNDPQRASMLSAP